MEDDLDTPPRQPYAVVDDSHEHIIRARVVGPLTDASYQAYLDELAGIFARRRTNFVVIVEQGRLQSFPPRYVRMTSAWLANAERSHASRWRGAAFVLHNPVYRGALRALIWAARTSVPMPCFATVEAAESWAEEQLARAAS